MFQKLKIIVCTRQKHTYLEARDRSERSRGPLDCSISSRGGSRAEQRSNSIFLAEVAREQSIGPIPFPLKATLLLPLGTNADSISDVWSPSNTIQNNGLTIVSKWRYESLLLLLYPSTIFINCFSFFF